MATEAVARKPELVRAAVVPLAVGIVVLAAITDAGGWWELALLVVAGGVLVAWARWPRLPALTLAAGVLAPVVLAQLTGQLEPAMFLVSLLALAVAGWEDSRPVAVAVGVAAVASPVLLAALQPPDERIAATIWMAGIAFPWCMGWLIHRQELLTSELEAARWELSQQALTEERRRIARDVHDLVGHGLASMLLQVTSARHVLRRDLDAADEALTAAGDAGRRSMQELRRTVALLRGDGAGEGALAALPGAAGIGELVDAARAGGLDVAYHATGDLARVDAAVGVALYRIVQESLANAARHAPGSPTAVRATVENGGDGGDGAVRLEVETCGPLPVGSAAGGGNSGTGFGLLGMRERAEVAGGELHAGPSGDGWVVRCRIPLGEQARGRDGAAAG